jgi:hypothetical protein
VRTGHLPAGLPAYGTGSPDVERYDLFVRCWRKVRNDYQNAVGRKEVLELPPAFGQLIAGAPTQSDWQSL